MSSFYQSVIEIISKPKEKRQAEEIHHILAWFFNLFKRKSSVFGDIDIEVVRDIIKNCSFETKNPDDIIIRQGDIGDCFYINLRGKVSIYLNHKKHEDSDNLDALNSSIDSDETQNNKNTENEDLSNESLNLSFDVISNEEKSKKLREKLGNFITSLGAGEGFGEIALVSEDNRTASIIADEITDLMVVNKSLYARCLQAPAQRKLNEKQKFINNSPFFGQWTPKMKKLLSLCLERDVIPYDSYLQKQGETADKIYFIISGSAKVTVRPESHFMQYPRLYPLKLPENVGKEIISSWIDEKNAILNNRKSMSSRAQSATPSKTYRNSQVIKRRNETFAQAEQRLKIKKIEVGIIGPGEISGLTEIISELPTYMQSIQCIEDCDVFYIYKRSYERLVCKRNPQCVNKMKDYAYMKLMSRNDRLKNKIPVDLYRCLQYKIELDRKKKRAMISIKTKAINFFEMPLVKGPIIQLDTKPKLAAYNRLSRRNTLLRNEEIPKDSWITDNLSKFINTESFSENDNFHQSTHDNINKSSIDNIQKVESNNSAFGLYENETQDQNNQTLSISQLSKNFETQELENLENRIKRWHMGDAGCKKPCVTKLNRIDIDKMKIDVKVGGNIFIRKSQMNSNKTSRLRRGSGYSSDSSSSENNSSENENEFISNSRKLFNSLKINNLNSSGEQNNIHLRDIRGQSPIQSFNLTPLNHNELPKNNFIDNFLAYISSDSNNESHNESLVYNNTGLSIEDSNLNIKNIESTQQSSTLSYLNYQNIENHNRKMDIKREALITSQINNNNMNTSSQINLKSSQNCNSEVIEKITELNLNENSDLIESQIGLNTLKDQSIAIDTSIIKCESFVDMKLINESKGRKKSLPNIVFRNHRQSSLIPQYAVKKKFSLGQVKVQHTGKKYTKQEYETLKAELKKQSRRFSMPGHGI